LDIFKNTIGSIFLHLLGVGFITILLFVNISSEPETYVVEFFWSFGNAFLLWFGNGILITVLAYYIPWGKKNSLRIFVQLGLSTLFTVWQAYYALKYLYVEVYSSHFSIQVFRKGIFVFLAISILFHAIYSSIYFFRNWQASIFKSEQLKRQNLATQYDVLKNQINPHFLFNSINTLLGLINENKDLAVKYGEYFSKVYRYILEQGKEELVKLQVEIEIIDINIKLLESRFGDNLTVLTNIDNNDLDKMIPPLTLHMLLENAIKHNIASKSKPLRVTINSIDGNKISVINNLQKKSTVESTQLGLTNIIDRYKYLTDDKVSIEKSDETFKVILPLIEKERGKL